MKILHICNDYSYSKVYKNLYSKLDDLGVEQIIYHPLRNNENRGNNVFDFKTQTSKIIYSSFILSFYHRLFFKNKIKQIYQDVLKLTDFRTVDCSYPTTLFSDGAVALKLFKEFKIPYVVAVRNTDVNLFLKYRPDLINLGLEILTCSEKIIFISEGLKEKFYSHILIKGKQEKFRFKTLVIPNGIDDFWLKNIVRKQSFKPDLLRFLFIGRFDHNKNIVNSIKAIQKIRDKYPGIVLNLVGGKGNKNQEVLDLIKTNSDWINFHGFVSDKSKLLNIYRQNDFFIMPSVFETFGLVFIEALSQGLPVLYTRDQGIDGLFSDCVGEKTYPNKKSIKEAILKMINKTTFNFEEIDFDTYNWEKIAKKYESIFNDIK